MLKRYIKQVRLDAPLAVVKHDYFPG